MKTVAELVEEIKAHELPLLDLYRELETAASGRTEKLLAGQMLSYQKFQVKSLDLFSGQMPDKFHSFGAIVEDDVNVRSGAAPSYPVITKVNKGTPVIITEFVGNWAHVQLPDGQRGFVFRAYAKSES
ncbi:MAG: SH3 domain-containing protein [Bacillota bacterium]